MTGRLKWWLMWAVGLDPLMRKESYGLSRQWQTYVGRVLYVGVLAIVISLVWQAWLRERMDYSAYSRFGQVLFTTFSHLQFYMVALTALSLSSDMISREVRAGTLGILAITPLSAWKIAFGKWKFCVGYLLIVLLSGVPILSLGLYLGGVTGLSLLIVSILTISTVMLCAAFGILVSTYMTGSHLTTGVSILGMAAFGLLPLLGTVVFDEDDVLLFLCFTQPPYSLTVTLVERGGFGPGWTAALEYSWMTSSGLSSLLALLFLVMAARRVAKLVRAEPSAPMMRRAFEGLDRLFLRWSFGIRVWAERAGVWDFNPFLWKEMRSRVEGRFRYFLRIFFVILFLIVVVAVVASGPLDEGTTIIVYLILMLLLFISAIGAGAAAFTKEKEGRKWEVLLTTPVKTGQIVWAKVAGAAMGTVHLVVILLLFTGLAWLSYWIDLRHRPFTLALLVLSMLAFSFFILSAGVMFSLLVDTTRKAFALTLGVVIFWAALLPIGVAVFSIWADVTYGGRSIHEFLVYSTNPFIQLSWIADRSMYHESERLAAFIVFMCLYPALALGCLLVCRQRFKRLMGRRN